MQETYFGCMNVDCGHRCVAQFGIVRNLVPGRTSNADVSSPIVERRANDIIVPLVIYQAAAEAPTNPPTGAAGSHYATMSSN